MKEREAINRLMCGNTAHSCKADYIKLAIKALEKQVPMNWETEDSEFDTIYKCPACKEYWALFEGTPTDNDYNYCPACGQALRYKEEADGEP